MADFESTKETKSKEVAKKKLEAKVVTKLDNTPASVLKWASEGRELFFDDDDFLELPEEVFRALSDTSKVRYKITLEHVLGGDVVKNATDAIRGFTTDFNVRGDDPNRQMMVKGKDPAKVYHWGRPDKHSPRLQKGWVVDHDSNVQTAYKESCNYKTIGGQNQPEMILYSKSREAHLADQAKRKANRDGMVKRAQENFKSDVARSGGKAIVQADNG